MKHAYKEEFKAFCQKEPRVYRAMLPFSNAWALLRRPRQIAGITLRAARIPCTDGASIKAYWMEPEGVNGPLPCLVYYHGGAFVMEAARVHYMLAAEYAVGARCRVLFVQYRLAPRHRFPVPFQDCLDAYRWVLAHAAQLAIDPARIAIGGDSAGGCLAAAVGQKLRDEGDQKPCLQLLIYPVMDRRMQTRSMQMFTDTPLWNARLNKKMWRWYCPDPSAADIAYASPAQADTLAGLHNAYIETAQFDCLCDEAIAYASAMREAGCTVELNETSGTIHGFDAAFDAPTTRACVKRRIRALEQAFAACSS